MDCVKRGFLIRKNKRIIINHKKTNSILLNRLQLDFLLRNKQYMKGNLLDAGCGEKPYSLIYDELVDKSIGCDVEQCVHEKNLIDVFASIDNLPFNDEEFDTVLSTNVLEHVANSEMAFYELCRVLKEEGYLILSLPFLYPVHEEPFDFYRFTANGIKHILEKNGMEIVHMFSWGSIGMMLLVYLNLFLCKFIKISPINMLACFFQEIEYEIYRKISLEKLLKHGTTSGLGKTISTGYFVIAQKKRK